MISNFFKYLSNFDACTFLKYIAFREYCTLRLFAFFLREYYLYIYFKLIILKFDDFSYENIKKKNTHIFENFKN